MKRMQKLLSVILLLAMLLSLAPVSALAEAPEGEPVKEGEPSFEEPAETIPPAEEAAEDEPAAEVQPAADELTDTEDIEAWNALREQILNAENGSTIVLDADYIGDDTVDRILITTGKTLTIDLNGHRIDRNRRTVTENGHVIVVQAGANLTIMDSSGDDSGLITGGWAYNGGGINNSGTLTITGGTINGNTAESSGNNDGRGGGIANYGTLTITGGVISGNTAYAGGGIGIRPGSTADPCVVNISGGQIVSNIADEGGGISSAVDGNKVPTVTLTNATISYNRAYGCGGGIRIWGGTFTFNSGIISNNEAGYHGGAIYIEESQSRLNIYGGTISSNTAHQKGGGIYHAGTIMIQGSPVILGNSAEIGNDVYLLRDKQLFVTGELNADARIGVMLEPGTGRVTYDFSTYCDESALACFVASPGYDVYLNDGEIWLDRFISYVERSWDSSRNQVVSETRERTARSLTAITSFDGNKIFSGGWYYVDGLVGIDGTIVFTGSANLILCDGASLLTKGVYFGDGTTLTIYGQQNDSGLLSAESSSGGNPGIGGAADYIGGSLVVHGGMVVAQGDTNAAGIGGGNHQSGFGEVKIFGGIVHATGGSSGAGIGKGQQNDTAGEITIYGGTVNATGGKYGAGIGGGEDRNGGTIRIYGGNVTAQGGDEGAGIGSGGDCETDGQKITIYGGEIKAYGGKYGPGIGGANKSCLGTVTIEGGKIEAYGGDEAAGIGCGHQGRNGSGTIRINSGTVTATGGVQAAGIGDGYDSSTTVNIVITGGKIVANGGAERTQGRGGAGIGGGASPKTNEPFEGSITISGGDIFARSPDSAAGIGTAKNSPLTGSIRITGGTVHAISGNSQSDPYIRSGAGIGAGYDADVKGEGSIIITGGTVTAESFSYMITGAGIGAGGCGNMQGTIEISGGNVTAVSKIFSSEPGAGAGIGAGAEESATGGGGECSGTVKISGGTVIAYTNDDEACAIGYGWNGNETGTRLLYNTASVSAGSSEANASLRPYNSRVAGFGEMYCRIEPCVHDGHTYTTTAETHTMVCSHCISGFTPEPHEFDDHGLCTVCGYQATLCTVSFDANGGSGSMAAVSVVLGSVYTLPDCGFNAPLGMDFEGWRIGGSEEEKQPGDEITVTADTTVTAQWITSYTLTFLPGAIDGTPVPGEPLVYSSDDPDNWADQAGDGKFFCIDPEEGIWFCYPYCPYEAPEGYTFTGWLVEGEDILRQEGQSYPVENCTLTAQWEREYSITTLAMPGDYASWLFVHGFAGEGTLVNLIVSITQESWESGYRLQKIMVTGDDGTVIEITRNKEGELLSESTPAPVPGVGCLYTCAFTMPAANVTIEALFSAPASVTVSFDPQGGTVEPESAEIGEGEALGALPVPEREGWVFLGWYMEPAASAFDICQATEVTAATTFTENTTVFAHWRLPGDVNGDGNVDGTDVTLLATYVKAGGLNVRIVPYSGDVSGDDNVDGTDVTLLATFVKAGGQGVVIH